VFPALGDLYGVLNELLGVAIVGFGLGSQGFRPIWRAYLVELMPESVAGGGLDIVRALYMAFGDVVGIVSDRASFETLFGLLLALLAFSLPSSQRGSSCPSSQAESRGSTGRRSAPEKTL